MGQAKNRKEEIDALKNMETIVLQDMLNFDDGTLQDGKFAVLQFSLVGEDKLLIRTAGKLVDNATILYEDGRNDNLGYDASQGVKVSELLENFIIAETDDEGFVKLQEENPDAIISLPKIS